MAGYWSSSFSFLRVYGPRRSQGPNKLSTYSRGGAYFQFWPIVGALIQGGPLIRGFTVWKNKNNFLWDTMDNRP